DPRSSFPFQSSRHRRPAAHAARGLDLRYRTHAADFRGRAARFPRLRPGMRSTWNTLRSRKADYLGSTAVEPRDSRVCGVRIDMAACRRQAVDARANHWPVKISARCSKSELLCIQLGHATTFRSMTMRRYLGLGVVFLALFAAGCARTDQQVAADVQNKISADSNIPDKQVTVSSTGGVVTLAGTVTRDAARNAAANDAAQVTGVKTVVNDLKVTSTAADNTQSAGMPSQEPQAEASNNPPPAPAPRGAVRPSPRSS